MAARYSFTFLLFALCSCSLFRANDERFAVDNRLYVLDTPNPDLVGGMYINRLDPGHDTLCLSRELEFGPLFGIANIHDNQLFFLLTRDSLGKPTEIRGTFNYHRVSYESGDSTGYITLSPNDRKVDWTCRVRLQDSAKNIKLLTISDFLEHPDPSSWVPDGLLCAKSQEQLRGALLQI
ncbi:MAG: hypothetical protein Q8916_00930 [Bacteroidota bacterium]|nr:hypothetical protein [Bacteroidota bacterium]MDP4228950.1 hypothetical protein [Bacteroidota bacterium]MDP4237140.1 hypothetical protein [Bacteroidota bacterium]